MEETLSFLKTWVAFWALFASAVALVVALTWEPVRDAYVRANSWARAAFFAAVAGLTLYGGSKGTVCSVSFPYTDPEARYLADAGSYVTNDWVHVAYTKNIIVPSTANLFVYRCDIRYTNEYDVASHSVMSVSNTIAGAGTSFDYPFPAATNYNWYVFTDWTPPPVTHTNGVAYVTWQLGSDKPTNDIVTARTGIYVNSVRMAPDPAMTNLPPAAVNLVNTTTVPE